MKITYCTIITADYLHYALALYHSISRYHASATLNVLITDHCTDLSYLSGDFPQIRFDYAKDLCNEGIAKNIKNKYAVRQEDCFRWSMKPVYITHLLRLGFDQVFYLDGDLFFFSGPDFLSEELSGCSVLLTPHWRTSAPQVDPANFEVLQTSGLYNAGFVAASRQGIPAMEWWASVCEYQCIKDTKRGLFADQAYLNLLPIYFDGVKILRHRGCNVANWNQIESRRTLPSDGRIKIDNKWDIVFIHFTLSTINGIRSGDDGLLLPYLEEYQSTLEKFRAYLVKNSPIPLMLSQSSTIAPVTHLQPGQTADDFLAPSCRPAKLDRYLIRSSILEALQHYHKQFSGILLDVGCGQSPYKPLLMSPPGKVARYIGLDMENSPIHKNQPDITWHEGKIPLGDNSVDCAIFTEVLEHCPDPNAVLKEICRVLKPNGFLFLTVPFLWPLHEVPHDEYRYTPFSLRRHLAISGFTNIDLHPLGGWDASLAQLLGLWVRRRPMKGWIRTILSYLLLPLIRWLIYKDRQKTTSLLEGSMITGLSGTARKAIGTGK
jgi:ubiquinone/menaquinone biosynthesis C-methylase UbiE